MPSASTKLRWNWRAAMPRWRYWPALVVLLPAANDELALLERHVELIAGEARHRKRDAQPLRAVGVARNALDIVGRIAVRSLGDPIEHALDLVEAEQKRTGKRRNPGHASKPFTKRLCRALPAPVSGGIHSRPTFPIWRGVKGAARRRPGPAVRPELPLRMPSGPGSARSASAVNCASCRLTNHRPTMTTMVTAMPIDNHHRACEPLDFAPKRVSGEAEERCPDQRAKDVGEHELPERHPVGAGQHARDAAQHRHEAADENDLAALAQEQIFPELDAAFGEVARSARIAAAADSRIRAR